MSTDQYSVNLSNSWKKNNFIIDYSDLNDDKTIKGKYKICFEHNNNENNISTNSTQILFFFSQYTKYNNIEFHHSKDDGSFEDFVNSLNNPKIDNDDDDDPKQTYFHRLPDFLYKNLECEYKGHKLWISNIPFYEGQLGITKSKKTIIIVSHDIEDRKTLYNIFIDVKEWNQKYVTNYYARKEHNRVYTFRDGYWELKKGNKKRNKETLFLDSSDYNNILDRIKKFSSKEVRNLYNRLNIPYKLNILLYGPPGTGKTSFIEVVSSITKRKLRFMQITPKIKDDDFTDALARLGKNDILVCEDIDCLFVDRKDNDGKKNGMTFSGLLNSFDGINASKNGLIIFMTTNYKCSLDSALTRPGRIDVCQEFKYMKRNDIERMIKFYFEDNFNQDDFNKFADFISSDNITGAIMSTFLLQLIMNNDYNLVKNKRKIRSILNDNDYEKISSISKALYS